MYIGPNSSQCSPSSLGEPTSDFIDNSVDETRYIQPPDAHSNSSETKALANRSVIETKIITSDELKDLILGQKFSNNVHYQVEGDLYLEAPTALPEHLSVGGDLDCTGLTALPEHLSVGGGLYLVDCPGLTALPEHLFVGGDFFLGGCTGLTALPNWITTLGRTTQGNIRFVNFENTGLSDTLIDRLREVETTGMRFYFSRSARQPKHQFSNVVEGLTFWRQLTSADSEIPKLNLRHDQSNDLVRYLGRLTNTADYNNQATRPILAQRVMAVPALLTGSDGIRDEAMDHIHRALTSCDDRIILALDDLETFQLLDSAEKKAFAGNADELRELGLQMMRLDKVKRIARDHMKTLSWVDEIEVELAFQIGVRQQLALPGSTQHMIFRGCASVSDQDIANAVNQVNTHCSDDNLQAYLAQWTPWQKYQRLQEVPTYDQLPQKTVDRIEDCVISAEITPKMVALGDHHLDYDALVKAVVENGKNPLTTSPMDWSNVFRLTKEDSPPAPLNKDTQTLGMDPFAEETTLAEQNEAIEAKLQELNLQPDALVKQRNAQLAQQLGIVDFDGDAKLQELNQQPDALVKQRNAQLAQQLGIVDFDGDAALDQQNDVIQAKLRELGQQPALNKDTQTFDSQTKH